MKYHIPKRTKVERSKTLVSVASWSVFYTTRAVTYTNEDVVYKGANGITFKLPLAAVPWQYLWVHNKDLIAE